MSGLLPLLAGASDGKSAKAALKNLVPDAVIFGRYASEGPAGYAVVGQPPVVRAPISTTCLSCPVNLKNALLNGAAAHDIQEVLDHFILSSLDAFHKAHPDVPLMLHGSFGLYARAANEYGEVSPEAWRVKYNLPRHGDIDVVVATPAQASQLGQFIAERFKTEAFDRVVRFSLDIDQILTAQQEQIVDGNPVAGLMMSFIPSGCRKPKSHNLYKLDICSRAMTDSSEVTMVYAGKTVRSYTIPVASWDQLWEALERDNRDHGARAQQRLRALEQSELTGEVISVERLEKIHALWGLKLPSAHRGVDQRGEEDDEIAPIPYSQAVIKPRVASLLASSHDDEPSRPFAYPKAKAKGSKQQYQRKVNTKTFPVKDTVSAITAQLAPDIKSLLAYSAGPGGLDSALLSRLWITVAADLRVRYAYLTIQAQDEVLIWFWQQLQDYYPSLSPSPSWLISVQDLVFNRPGAPKRAQKIVSSEIYLARQLMQQLNEPGEVWFQGRSVSVRGEDVPLVPVSLGPAFPKSIQTIVDRLGGKKIDGWNQKVRLYGQMLIFVERVIKQANRQKSPVLLVPAHHQSEAILVHGNGFCNWGSMEALIARMKFRSDVIVYDDSGTAYEGTWIKTRTFVPLKPQFLPQQRMLQYSQKRPQQSLVSVVTTQGSFEIEGLDNFSGSSSPASDTTSVATLSPVNSLPKLPVSSSSPARSETTKRKQQSSANFAALEKNISVFDRWASQYRDKEAGLLFYRNLTKHLLANPDFQAHSLLKRKKSVFNLRDSQTAGWLKTVQTFLQTSMKYQKEHPESKPGLEWRSDSKSYGFLPALVVSLSGNNLPVSLEHFRLTGKTGEYRDALYLLWIVLVERSSVHLLGHNASGQREQLSLIPVEKGLRMYQGAWQPAQETGLTLWLGKNGYMQVKHPYVRPIPETGESTPESSEQVLLKPYLREFAEMGHLVSGRYLRLESLLKAGSLIGGFQSLSVQPEGESAPLSGRVDASTEYFSCGESEVQF